MAKAKKKRETKEDVPKIPKVDKQSEKKESVLFDDVFVIANGKYVNSRRGILPPGEEVFDIDFPGGSVSLSQHIKSGNVVKRKVARS